MFSSYGKTASSSTSLTLYAYTVCSILLQDIYRQAEAMEKTSKKIISKLKQTIGLTAQNQAHSTQHRQRMRVEKKKKDSDEEKSDEEDEEEANEYE